MKEKNHLANETSPYLLQHVHNPVDWYPWGAEALDRAKTEDKPILVSIGYAACHWCHVMERESFEDEDVAAYMNEHFINIKIDREERPDLDHIYMDALTAMTGSGGWPLNVFLTPDRKPFYGGTYFPPSSAYNRPSWTDVLAGVANAYKNKREEILAQAENLTQHLVQSNSFGIDTAQPVDDWMDAVQVINQNLLKSADKERGGFGHAPKFPQTFSIAYLLRYYHFYGDNDSLQQALLSLDKMIKGGIYDQVGGGLARYSTDTEWLVPHFEKMLYDQALFLSVVADAWQITRKPLYKETIGQTMQFLSREMLSPGGGFYSALDADSEGVEGKFYVWDEAEFREVAGADADLATAWFGVTGEGNWEETNILTRPWQEEELARQFGLEREELQERIGTVRQALLEARSKRVRPGLDDKLILGWNALLNQACSKVYAATGDPLYLEMARKNMAWMLATFRKEGVWYHVAKEGDAGKGKEIPADSVKYPAFLDDLAYLVQALIYMQEVTGETIYLDEAVQLTKLIIESFGEEGNLMFYYTNRLQSDVVVRKREVYDGAQPSGNAVMVFNLNYLGIAIDKPDWRERADKMLASFGKAATRYPGSFGVWAGEILRANRGCEEIVVVGPAAAALRNEILANFIPHRILQSATHENQAYPLLRNKPSDPETLIYLCKDYSCQQPVNSVDLLLGQLKKASEE
ncbi:thioredoxin domain-containing protein [Flavihumibacter rivuli]|uniref:thioredoxin domain-containing protein n=1 Tax=Flavihumibacter rivuli TaxID=2838156 RepID=UPI001BDF6D0A|nr:thioredoxin domain-containing protein [Flavihumibacter rivuli]ULQ56312.1 thioredoxin domain-containing protein [Flavihumibacter rivuli]